MRHVAKHIRINHNSTDAVYYCAYCGCKLRKTFGNDTYFSCPTAPYHESAGCKTFRWSKTALEDILFASLKAQITIVEVDAQKPKPSDDSKVLLLARLKQLQSEIEAANRAKLSLYERYRSREISMEKYKTDKQQLDNRLASLSEQLSSIEAEYEQLSSAVVENTPKTTFEGLATLSDDALREVMYDAVDRVIVSSNDQIEIVWRFDEAPTSV